MDSRMTLDWFLEKLLTKLVQHRRTALRFDDPSTLSSFRRMVEAIYDSAKGAHASQNHALYKDLLRILDAISPNPNTGAYDGLWLALRELQPDRVQISNPTYKSIEFNIAGSGFRPDTEPVVPPDWFEVVERSAKPFIAAAQ